MAAGGPGRSLFPRPLGCDWDVHTSYHLDGTMHMKSFGHKRASKKLQRLTGAFKGTEHLGSQMGHGPKGVGAICDPADFSGLVEVVPGILGPRDGSVVVDLVEPNCERSIALMWYRKKSSETPFHGL